MQTYSSSKVGATGRTHSICSAFALAAVILAISMSHAVSQELESFPKNWARLHMESTLLEWNAATNSFVETSTALAWLDDDETTGAPVPAGHHRFVVKLSEPTLLKSFALSSGRLTGRLNLFVADEQAVPGADAWIAVATDVAIADVDGKLLVDAFSRYGRYLLIDMHVEQEGLLHSLYLFGNDSVKDFHLEEAAGAGAAGGQDLAGRFDVANLYSSARVVFVANGGETAAWQAMIDDSPESFWLLPPATEDTPSAIIDLGSQRQIQTLSFLGQRAEGRLEFFLLPAVDMAMTGGTNLDWNTTTPDAALALDGSVDRSSRDIGAQTGRFLVVRWMPANESDPIKLHQIDAFGEKTYAVVSSELPAVAEGGKNIIGDGKGFKGLLDPIAEGPLDEIAEGNPPPLLPLLTTPPLTTNNPDPTPTPTPPPPSPQSP